MKRLNLPSFSDLSLPDLPKKVALSLAVIGASIAIFILLALTLGAANTQTETDVIRLKNDVVSTQKNLRQSKEDYEFIIANKDKYETLLSGDKLIPHTRRTAIRQMQALALEFGLSSLTYTFDAVGAQTPQVVSNQPQSGLYNVSVEKIELMLGAPLDRSMYAFMAAIHDDFPGSMVLSELELERAPAVAPEALNKISLGSDSGLVKGKAVYSWRTAQQNKEDEKGSGN